MTTFGEISIQETELNFKLLQLIAESYNYNNKTLSLTIYVFVVNFCIIVKERSVWFPRWRRGNIDGLATRISTPKPIQTNPNFPNANPNPGVSRYNWK